MNFDEAVWKDDATTRKWRERNADKLKMDVKDMEASFLGEAISYCIGFGNPFVRELLSRANLFDEFVSARTALARSKVMDKAGDKFGILFF